MSSKQGKKLANLERRSRRVRKTVSGSPSRPRLSVYRSLNHIYAQIIDDVNGKTLVASSSLALKIAGGNATGAKEVGKQLAERAKAENITRVSFDRNGRLYHGRIKALAEGAREGGLEM